jgi:hypothetical protein
MLSDSRWVTRGWTLQELIAPGHVDFFGMNWQHLGSKASLANTLSDITKIYHIALEQPWSAKNFSIATRMSWATNRRTTRVEDRAYSLFGIFEVNMPVIYGEGARSFHRLQEEILKKSNDLSILAWNRNPFTGTIGIGGLLAPSPSNFNNHRKIVSLHRSTTDELHRGTHHEFTNLGFRITLPVLDAAEPLAPKFGPPRFPKPEYKPQTWGILNCRFQSCLNGYVGLGLWHKDDDEYWISSQPLTLVSNDQLKLAKIRSIFLVDSERAMDYMKLLRSRKSYIPPRILLLRCADLLYHGFEVMHADPEDAIGSWDPLTFTSELSAPRSFVLRKFGFVHPQHNEAFLITVFNNDFIYQDNCGFRVKMSPKFQQRYSWLRAEGIMERFMRKLTREEEELWTSEGYTCLRVRPGKTSRRATFKAEFPSSGCFTSVTVALQQEILMGEDVCVLSITASEMRSSVVII